MFRLDFLERALFRLRAIFGAIVFHRWGIYIRVGSRIEGSKHIKIDAPFGAGKGLWLAAIDSYAGNRHSPILRIGSNVSLGDDCHIASINKIEIGDNVLVGSRVHITDHSHGNYTNEPTADSPDSIPLHRKLYSAGPVKIGDNVWIGDGVVVLPNVSVGNGAVIGANSVVTRNIPAGTIVAGVPAQVVKIYSSGRWYKSSTGGPNDG
jgi:acetyltransferase-like isoleucine patch superfamily enzyme